MIQVYIIRGLPGTGKTSLAQSIAHPSLIFSADDFFVARGKGSYAYDPALIGEAHSDCFKRFNNALMAQVEDFATNGGLKYHDREFRLVVTNTFHRCKNIEPYINTCNHASNLTGVIIRFWVIDLFDQGMSDAALASANVHGVSEEKIGRLRRDWEFGRRF